MPEKFTPETPAIQTPEGLVAAPRLSRRKLLQSAVAVAATPLLQERLAAEILEVSVDSLPETIRSESFNKKINFTGPSHEMTPEINTLIQQIGEYQHAVALTMGMEFGINVAVNIQNPTQAQQHVVNLQKNLWKTLTAHIPNLPSYSREQFYRTLTYDLPNLLARFGIYTQTVSSVSYNKKTGELNGVELLVGFTKIRSANRTSITRRDKTIQRDIISLGDALTHSGQKAFSLFKSKEPAETTYQTIFLRENTIEETWNKFVRAARFSTENIRSREQLMKEMSESTGEQQRHVALNVAIVELRSILDELNLTKESLRENIIAHETGHLWDAVDSSQTQPPPEPVTSASNFYTWSGNSSIHNEITGFSQELRNSPQKYFILYQMIYNENPENQEHSDFAHSKAIQWIMNTAVNILAQDPKRYSVMVDRHSSVEVNNQMITQLPRLLQHTNDIESLADAIIAEHQRHSNIDFSEEYLKSKGVARTKKPLVAPETLIKATTGTVIGGAAVYGFKKLSERKRIGEGKKLVEDLFKDAVDLRQKFLNGLQLDASSQQVDDFLRQQTFKELIHESRSRPELRHALAKLELLMNEKNQKKLQKSLTGEAGNQE